MDGKTGVTSYPTREEIENAPTLSRDQVIKDAGTEFDGAGVKVKGITRRQYIDSALGREGNLPKLTDSESEPMRQRLRRSFNGYRWVYE